MNFRLARDQVVLPETAANLWTSRRQANDFIAVFSSSELGGITKHLMAGYAGNSEFCFPWGQSLRLVLIDNWTEEDKLRSIQRGKKTFKRCFPREKIYISSIPILVPIPNLIAWPYNFIYFIHGIYFLSQNSTDVFNFNFKKNKFIRGR